MQVCIIGLGYVGLTLAVYLAKKGKSVHGIDISAEVLSSLDEKRAHFYEAGFDALLEETLNAGNFTYSKEFRPMNGPVVYIVTVGTPIDTNNKVKLGAIEAVAHQLSNWLKDQDLVVLRSTVKVGITRETVKPILDQSKVQYRLAFCPERTLEGCAFEELANLPQIISGIDAPSLTAVKMFFHSIDCETVDLQSVEEAEMVKLLNNSERDLMFALANEIALMCDAKGLNAHRIIEAANYKYPRTRLKKPGPVGGPCLEKDPYILTESFQNSTYQPTILMAGRKVNELMVDTSLQRVCELLDQKLAGTAPRKMAILGFAFKGNPPTSDMRGSLVFAVIRFLQNRYPQTILTGHDYLASAEAINAAGAHAFPTVAETIADADLVILQNNHPHYKNEPWSRYSQSNVLIFDFWNQLADIPFNDKNYISLGSGYVTEKI